MRCAGGSSEIEMWFKVTAILSDKCQGEQSTTFAGFSTLCQRMKEGKQFCDDFHSYLKQR